MTHSQQIFVAAPHGLREFAEEVETLLGVDLARISTSDDSWYEGKLPGVKIDILKHSLENDRDMAFEKYQYQISIWPDRSGAQVDPEELVQIYAREVYNRLRNHNSYP